MWKTDDMKHKTSQLKKLLDGSIMEPLNIQIPGIIDIIVDEYLEYRCFNNHISFVVDEEMMKRGLGYLLECVTRIDYGVSGACEGGYLDLIEQLIRLRSYSDDVNWDWALLSACRGGHIPIIKLVLSQDSRNGRYSMLEEACKGGHLPAIEFIINYREKNITNCAKCKDFTCACERCDTFCDGLKAACCYGHISAIDLMISYGADNFNSGLEAACRGRHIEAANLMIQHGADDWHGAIKAACSSRCLPIIELILNHVDGEVIISSGMREIIEKLRNAQNKK